MSRLTKEINIAARTNKLNLMQILGKIDFEVTGKHLTGKCGRIVHCGDSK